VGLGELQSTTLSYQDMIDRVRSLADGAASLIDR
jgi:hypothetical protein